MSISADSAASGASASPSEEELNMCPRCPEGRQYKPLSKFSNDRTTRDGKQRVCKECSSKNFRDRYAKRERGDNGDDDDDDEDDDGETAGMADDWVREGRLVVNYGCQL